MTESPPSSPGAVHETVAVSLYAVALPIVGAPGTVRGFVEAFEDADPWPAAFVAFTLNVYVVPFERPDTVQLVPELVHVWPPGLAVTV